MFHDFSAEFPHKDLSLINLNNGTLALSPQCVLQNQYQEIMDFEKNTSLALTDAWRRLWLVQKELALFLGASPCDLFIRPNVTLALNDILMGLSLPKNSEIVTCEFEYGAIVNILKLKAKNESLLLRNIQFDFSFESDLTDERIVQEIAAQISPQTSLVVLSHVFTGTGFKLPLNKVGKKLRELGIIFVVDGAHGPGMLPLNFQEDLSEVDFYAGNIHKWMMGPKGSAFGWAHPSKQSLLKNVYGSWTVFVDSPTHMQIFADGRDFALRMLWSHSQSFPVYYAIQETLNFWTKYGVDKIQQEISARSAYLRQELLNFGISPLIQTEKYQTSLLCYDLIFFDEKTFVRPAILKNPQENNQERPLMVGLPRVPQKKILRLSAHIHNDSAELHSAMQTLKACLK